MASVLRIVTPLVKTEDSSLLSGLGVATVWLLAQFSILSPLLLGDTILWLTSAELAEGIN